MTTSFHQAIDLVDHAYTAAITSRSVGDGDALLRAVRDALREWFANGARPRQLRDHARAIDLGKSIKLSVSPRTSGPVYDSYGIARVAVRAASYTPISRASAWPYSPVIA